MTEANTLERVKQIRRADPKIPAADIARQTGLSRQRVSQLLRKLNLPTDTRPAPKAATAATTREALTPAQVEAARKMLGLTLERAGAALGANPQTVHRWTIENNPLAHQIPGPAERLLCILLALGVDGTERLIEAGRAKLGA